MVFASILVYDEKLRVPAIGYNNQGWQCHELRYIDPNTSWNRKKFYGKPEILNVIHEDDSIKYLVRTIPFEPEFYIRLRYMTFEEVEAEQLTGALIEFAIHMSNAKIGAAGPGFGGSGGGMALGGSRSWRSIWGGLRSCW